jgi:predicted DNA-binding protein YlxM (UPF0122 family)
MAMMPKVARIALLYDFYGKLLTDKQQNIIELYYNQDLSLGEIAEENGISRQAIHDIIKRAETTLEEYEEKLGMLKKYLVEKSVLDEIVDILSSSQPCEVKLNCIKAKINKLIRYSVE